MRFSKTKINFIRLSTFIFNFNSINFSKICLELFYSANLRNCRSMSLKIEYLLGLFKPGVLIKQQQQLNFNEKP